jgi:predicted CopG family antitoxin
MNTKSQDMEKVSMKTVAIESDLYEELKKMIEETGFSTVDDYVTYLLRSQIGKKDQTQDLSDEDTEAVTSRLKALGYI